MTHDRQLEAIILAAGKGTRMNSDLPKVLHVAAGKPLVQWVVDACRAAGASRLVLVVGYQAHRVRDALAGQGDIAFVEQTEQLGTGHAAMMARPLYEDRPDTDVLVIAGDMPLFRGLTLAHLVEQHRAHRCAGSLATSELADPTGYGRIVRDADGALLEIIEHKDATEAQRAIREVNISSYCFDAAALFDALNHVSTDNAQGEYYITDVLGLLRRAGRSVRAMNVVPADEALGVNDPEQLARVDAMLRERRPAAPNPAEAR